jgi:hypothetical protein
MHFRNVILTVATLSAASVYSAPIPPSPAASSPVPLSALLSIPLSALERRADKTDEDLALDAMRTAKKTYDAAKKTLDAAERSKKNAARETAFIAKGIFDKAYKKWKELAEIRHGAEEAAEEKEDEALRVSDAKWAADVASKE